MKLDEYHVNVLKSIALIMFIVTCLIIIWNQAIGWYYKMEFLMQPCELCKEANKPQSKCIDSCFIVKEPLNKNEIQLVQNYTINFSEFIN